MKLRCMVYNDDASEIWTILRQNKTINMKHAIALIAIALGSISVSARTEAADSLPAQELQEIVIEAPKVIRKADMDVYHPSGSAVENSKTVCSCSTT